VSLPRFLLLGHIMVWPLPLRGTERLSDDLDVTIQGAELSPASVDAGGWPVGLAVRDNEAEMRRQVEVG